MSDPTNLPLQALQDGGAEVRLVLRLQWEDVAALGQEAGRLAAQLRRPVSLDEAASHRLRTRSGVAAPVAPVPERTEAPASASPAPAFAPRSPSDQARHAIDRINGVAG